MVLPNWIFSTSEANLGKENTKITKYVCKDHKICCKLRVIPIEGTVRNIEIWLKESNFQEFLAVDMFVHRKCVKLYYLLVWWSKGCGRNINSRTKAKLNIIENYFLLKFSFLFNKINFSLFGFSTLLILLFVKSSNSQR